MGGGNAQGQQQQQKNATKNELLRPPMNGDRPLVLVLVPLILSTSTVNHTQEHQLPQEYTQRGVAAR